MPDPKKYKDEESWMAACVPAVKEEGKDQDQAVAQCMNMWKERSADPKVEFRKSEDKKEIRVLPISEFRFSEQDGRPKFEGYAAVFNRWSEDLGGFKERIKPGAFQKALKNSDVRALFNHDQNYVLGRSTAGTLKISEDTKGLLMKNDPPETQWARDLMVSVNRGDISQMSFGFTVAQDEWKEDKDGYVTRTINEIDRLYDVSIVAFPAYNDTSVALRSLEKVKAEHEEDKPVFTLVEEPQEERGVTADDIKEIVSRVIGEVMQKDKGEPTQAEPDLSHDAEVVDLTAGENSEPTQGDTAEEVRNAQLNKKFKKYGQEFFLS